MGVARSIVRWLQDHGNDAVHLLDEGLEQLDDQAIFAKAVREQRIVLTLDLDFADIVAASAGQTVSVILFRLQRPRRQQVQARLADCLRELGPEIDRGAVVVVEEARFRVRRLPFGR
jgi:predicted nuclease of predicted toxin-antitoxin system